jgi:crossover junction endodeoxyribonuclease RuvC
MIIGGIDCGVRGGAAILAIDNGAAPRLVEVTDIPITGTGAKERVDAIALRDFFRKHKPDHVYVERAQSMPKQGSSSGFKYGAAYGAILAVLACCEIPVTVIEPTSWKKFHHLRGRDKEGGRARAIQLFPAEHDSFQRKKDHGRSDATLIAMAGAAP